jgi:PPOX class probable F420-dependent enzyme
MNTRAPAARAPLPDEIRSFLAAPRYAVVATLDADGGPHQATAWYGLTDDDAILLNSRATRHWPRNLERDGRVSIAVVDEARPQHWVGVKGTATRLHDGDAALEDIMALARRYGKDPEQYRGQQRVSFIVTIERTFEYES